MMLEFDDNQFEEVVEIYGGFPLKKDFLEIGNAALKDFGVEAVYEDGIIRIPYVERPYYTEEELQECRDEGFSDKDIRRMKESVFYAEVQIEVRDPQAGITDAGFDCWADGDGEFDDPEIWEDHLTDEEWDQQIAMIEAFLNATVDCGD